MSHSERTMLRVDKVSHEYGHSVALCEIDIKVLEGEFLSIIGPSGCGKTTLLKLMAGVLSPTKGVVRSYDWPTALPIPNEEGVLMIWQSIYTKVFIFPF